MSTQTFPNGTTLTSSALTPAAIQALFQQATCLCFGISNQVQATGILVNGQPTVTLDSVNGVANGYLISDNNVNIPANATILSIAGLIATMSANATGSATETVYITDPTAGFQVRQAWPMAGAPAWGQNDNVTFVRCTEVDNDYNKVRDEAFDVNNSTSALLEIEYTRVWRVFWEIRGPLSFDRARLLKTAMQLDFIHDMLAASNLYLMPRVGNPQRLPELIEGNWWERTDFEMEFYEQVNESIVTPTVASIPIQTINLNGVQTNVIVT